MSTEWDYAPQLRLLRFGCEPEQARCFTVGDGETVGRHGFNAG